MLPIILFWIFISVTPLQLDLTAYHVLTDLSSWQWQEQTKKPFFHLPAFTISKPSPQFISLSQSKDTCTFSYP